MNSISFIDYIKYTFFNVRNPEIVEKVKLNALASSISKYKHNFIDFKTGQISSECAKFIYEMYKAIYPFLAPLKEDFSEKSSKRFSYYLIESEFSEEQKKLVKLYSSEYILDQLNKGNKANIVFTNAKNSFVKFRSSIDGNKSKKTEINLQFSLLKDFSEILNFDFFMFLKLFNPNFVEGNTKLSNSFVNTYDINAIDDLTKLHSAIESITIRKELISVLNVYSEYRGMSGTPDKNIKVFLSAIKYLKTSNFLTDTITYLLKDFKYAAKAKFSNADIYTPYISNITKTFKSEIETIIRGIKRNEASSIRNNLFSGIEITKLININNELNTSLIVYELPYFEFIDCLEYIKTFTTEIYIKLYREPLNELFLALEFISKERSTSAFDAFYILEDAKKNIDDIDYEMTPQAENRKKLKVLLSSKNKAISNRDSIDSIITNINNKSNDVLVSVYNSLIDITTIIKNISEDYKNSTKIEVENASKINSLHDFNIEIANSILRDFDLFISLLKNFIR